MASPPGAPGPADDGGARHLAAGLALPDLALASTLGEAVNFSRWQGAAVVYVYPWTGRPGMPDPPGWDDIAGAHGSTPESEGFRDRYGELSALGLKVFGLSTQDGEHQRELSARLRLPFAILSDEKCLFQAALQLPTFTTGGVHYLKRLTLLIRDGRIWHTFYPVHPPAAHAGEVLAWLKQPGRKGLGTLGA
jgi:peroxiredoxin